MKNNIFLLVFCVVVTNLLVSCTNKNDKKNQAVNLSIVGKWYDVKDSSNTIEFNLINDAVIVGSSCFIFQNGNRIDCSESKNISLTEEKENVYSGKFYSDYMSDTLKVRVVVNNTLDLTFIDSYDFENKMTFTK